MESENNPEDEAPSPPGDAEVEDLASHLEELGDELEPEAGEPAAGAGAEDPANPPPGLLGVGPDGLYTRDAYHEGFVKLHKMAGHFTGYQTLLKAPETEEGRAASDAIYETCYETPALRWMLKPGNRWWARIAAIGLYGMALRQGVRQEVYAAEVAALKQREAMDDAFAQGFNDGVAGEA